MSAKENLSGKAEEFQGGRFIPTFEPSHALTSKASEKKEDSR